MFENLNQIEQLLYYSIRLEKDTTIQNFQIFKPCPQHRFWRL